MTTYPWTNDPVDHPSHYTNQGTVECIEITQWMDFCLGNAFKYVWRYKDKGKPREDLEKALWYLKRYRAHLLTPESFRPPMERATEAFYQWCQEVDYLEPQNKALYAIWSTWRFHLAGWKAEDYIKELIARCGQ